MFWRWWAALEYSVRTGESSVPHLKNVSSFESLHRRAEQAARFNRLMSEMVGAMAKGVVSAYDFGARRTVVDIGGGRGTRPAALLRAHPSPRGGRFGPPGTAPRARRGPARRG